MSADNYAKCPRCVKQAADRADRLAVEAAEAYGKVTADRYQAMIREASKSGSALAGTTFREDYEFYGAETGTVTASYSGYCSVCDLHLSFECEHPIPGVSDGP